MCYFPTANLGLSTMASSKTVFDNDQEPEEQYGRPHRK